MKRLLILSILFMATLAQAEELWFSGRQEDWEKKKNEGLYRAVALLNYCTTNEVVTTNGNYFVTNYVHTAQNTNNVLWQINFGYKDINDENAWIMGYNTLKCGGFDIDAQYLILEDFCTNNKKFTCGRGMGLVEYMNLHSYTHSTNWLTLSIPFVDDNRKAQERESEYKKEKKK